jgi:hypothetical protein
MISTSYFGQAEGLYEQTRFKRFMESSGRRQLRTEESYSLYYGAGEDDLFVSLTRRQISQMTVSGSSQDVKTFLDDLVLAEREFPFEGWMARGPMNMYKESAKKHVMQNKNKYLHNGTI